MTSPSPIWNQQESLPSESPTTSGGFGQTFGCFYCVQELTLDVPEQIFFVSGTTVCSNHISNFLGGQQ